jgi:hypothetical protein
MEAELTTRVKSQTIPPGYMTIEESRRLCHESIARIEEILQQRNAASYTRQSVS